MPSDGTPATFDAFISYARTDAGIVKRIVDILRTERFRVFLDIDTIRPGDRFEEGLEAGLLSSRACVVFVGPTGPTSWQANELRAAIREETAGASLRVIPVVLPSAKLESLPLFLRAYSWVDYRNGPDDAEAFQRLATGIRGSVESQAIITAVPDDSLFARNSTKVLFEQHSTLDLTGIDYSTSLPLTDLAKLVKLHQPDLSMAVIIEKLSMARASVYDAKYADRRPPEDERFLDFESWQQELESIVSRLIDRPDLTNALVVGIGNGNERPRLYDRFKSLTLTDVSPASLKRCESLFLTATLQHAAAEDLSCCKSGAFDLYISLRTFQSSFFNIRHAAFEANRVLRRGGIAIVSVPNVYLGSRAIGKGLQRGDGTGLDANLSWTAADMIRRSLLVAEFDCGIQTGLFEIYVTARKLAP
jgi:SAM-dependent methyltransferase